MLIIGSSTHMPWPHLQLLQARDQSCLPGGSQSHGVLTWHQALQGMAYSTFLKISGWWCQPLEKIWKSIGMILPSIWKNKKCSSHHQPDIMMEWGWFVAICVLFVSCWLFPALVMLSRQTLKSWHGRDSRHWWHCVPCRQVVINWTLDYV